jgi:hypothetical protein
VTEPRPAVREGSESEKCPTCGMTSIKFDPPLVFIEAEACGVLKPGNHAAGVPGGIPVCELPAGHDGRHGFLVEYLDRWT